MKLVLDEVRRLTGPNLLWQHSGAILDVLIEGVQPDKVIACWQAWARKCLDAFAWSEHSTVARVYEDGASLAISAPLDALYTACDLAELSWNCTVAELLGLDEPDWQAQLLELKKDLG